MPRPEVRPVDRAELGGRRRVGIIQRPAQPLPGGTPEHVWTRFHEEASASRERLDDIARALKAAARGPGVLETATIVIPGNVSAGEFEPGAPGVFSQDRYRVPYASVAVFNYSTTSSLVVSSGPPQSTPPGGGQGQFGVPPNSFRLVNMAGSSLTIYGPAGTLVDYTVMTSRCEPSASIGLLTPTLQASTGPPGFALTAGTGTILQWAAPGDGQLHRLTIRAVKNVTSAETGGGIQAHWTVPGGGAASINVFAGSQGTGGQSQSGSPEVLVAAGTTFLLQQSSGLSAGASTLYAELWAI